MQIEVSWAKYPNHFITKLMVYNYIISFSSYILSILRRGGLESERNDYNAISSDGVGLSMSLILSSYNFDGDIWNRHKYVTGETYPVLSHVM